MLLLVEVSSGFVQVSMFRLAIDGGRHTSAVITGLDPENHSACEYILTVGGRRIRGSDPGCVGLVGEKIAVTYLPTDPSIVTMDDPVTRFWEGSVVSLLAASFVGVGSASRLCADARAHGCSKASSPSWALDSQ